MDIAKKQLSSVGNLSPEEAQQNCHLQGAEVCQNQQDHRALDKYQQTQLAKQSLHQRIFAVVQPQSVENAYQVGHLYAYTNSHVLQVSNHGHPTQRQSYSQTIRTLQVPSALDQCMHQ